VQSHRVELFTVIGRQKAKVGLAQAHRLFEHGVEHRGEIAGGGIDDL